MRRGLLVERIEVGQYGQMADEFGDEAEASEILVRNVLQQILFHP